MTPAPSCWRCRRLGSLPVPRSLGDPVGHATVPSVERGEGVGHATLQPPGRCSTLEHWCNY
eukprot:3136710-Alexandrium_andersonii.AAC.1